MLKDLSGILEALTTTNSLLSDVLSELKETNLNTQRLDQITAEMRALNEKVGKIPFTG
jgi:hypothetical protein